LKIGLGVRTGVVAVIGTEQVHRTALFVPLLVAVSAAIGGFFAHDRAVAQDAPMCVQGVDGGGSPREEQYAELDDRERTYAWRDSNVASVLACMPGDPGYHVEARFAPSSPLEPLPASPARAPTEVARRAFAALAQHRAAGRIAEARISLATLEELVPELADRWSMIAAELRPRDRAACELLHRSTTSPTSSIAARARTSWVRCLLEVRDRRAPDELRALLARYPELPEALSLRLLEAERREERRDFAGAVAIYRDIDIGAPESPSAAVARERLERMIAAGHRVRPLTTTQLIERADRLVRSGPPDLARAEVARLQGTRLSPPAAAEVALMAARLARVEGRFDDAARLIRQARGLSPAVGDDPAAVAAQAEDLASAAAARREDQGRAELRRFVGAARTLADVPTTRLFGYLRTAARVGLRAEIDLALTEIATRSLPCGLRLDAAVVTIGVADDARVAELLERCVNASTPIAVASRYHRARALERAGRIDEARAELEQVALRDRSETRWYALWARQRLAISERTMAHAEPPTLDGSHDVEIGDGKTGVRALDHTDTMTVSPALPPPNPFPLIDGEDDDALTDESFDAPTRRWSPLPPAEIELRLARLAARHSDSFPWFSRALALVRLGDAPGATEELHEAYLAWNEARGHSPLRAGVEAVYRGATPGRIRVPNAAAWRGRRTFPNADRRDAAEISASLGDHGLAIRWDGPARAALRPRAFEAMVREVARERGLDPNLLLAVMRVESIYNPRIVSYAGAIGLLQIMPRTGRLIARSMGREAEFGIDDMLDPRTNIEMGAWYLASLIRRFDGRVPLAIASYNGGPHNVRRWLAEYSGTLTLEAFLEHIPFDQTHRYVRRVMGHWAAYRAQEGLPMVELETTLPELEADTVAF
jgi:soluble lytic murein transglycosylase-like protein